MDDVKKVKPNSFAVKILENDELISLNKENFQFVIALLKREIKKCDRYGALCFYIGDVCTQQARDLIYWYTDGRNMKAEMVAKYLAVDVDRCGQTEGFVCGYDYEHNILKKLGERIARAKRADYGYLHFDIKKIAVERFECLPDVLPERMNDSAYDVYEGADSAEEVLTSFFWNVEEGLKEEAEEKGIEADCV